MQAFDCMLPNPIAAKRFELCDLEFAEKTRVALLQGKKHIKFKHGYPSKENECSFTVEVESSESCECSSVFNGRYNNTQLSSEGPCGVLRLGKCLSLVLGGVCMKECDDGQIDDRWFQHSMKCRGTVERKNKAIYGNVIPYMLGVEMGVVRKKKTSSYKRGPKHGGRKS